MSSPRASLCLFLLLAGLTLLRPHKAAAQVTTYIDLYNFNCTALDFSAQTSTGTCNPIQPGILAQGTDGNLYGMACDYFTPCNYGSIFKMTPSGQITILYKFNGITAANPGVSGLTLGPDGNFYGVTPHGSAAGCGTVFQATPSGVVNTLHEFAGGSDGCNPVAPPVLGDDGYLYGTAANSAYRISTAGDFQVLTSSLPYITSNPPVGSLSPLLLASDGNFYGTAPQANSNGGLGSSGTVYKMSLNLDRSSATVTVLHNFFDASGIYAQGFIPNGGLVEGSDGNLYGTTTNGGLSGYGTVFQLTKDGSLAWVHSLPVVNDPAANYTNEGAYPVAGLIAASDGSFYGAGSFGGSFYGSSGTLFKIDSAGNLTVLYTFDAVSNNCGSDTLNCGIWPQSQPVEATSGLIYGMAEDGGNFNHSAGTPGSGVFYRLDAGLPAFVATIQPSGKVGDTIGILGQGFTGASFVTFNGLQATFNVVSDTYLTATVPAGATTGPVQVIEGVTTLATKRNFRILASSGTPVATSTTLASSLNPSVFGQAVTFTAVVTSGSGTPTGNVEFDDNDVAIGSTAVDGTGTATSTTSSLAAGSHTIKAVYSGDANYLGSTSHSLGQVVSAVAFTSSGALSAAIPPFGAVAVGSASSQTVLLLINSGLTLSSVQTSGDFTVTSNSCSLSVPLPTGTVCSLTMQFAPVAPGQRWFPLVAQDGNGNIYTFGLEGTGAGSGFAFTPGIISTVAGGGPTYVNGGLATDSSLNYPNGVAVDAQGNLYIADYGNNLVRRVDGGTSIIATVAGNGSQGYGGDGSVATTASLFNPRAVAVDAAGNLFIADANNQRVRKVDASTGYISTIAGTGSTGYNGDGEVATQASLTTPDGVAVDQNGNVFIADTYNNRIRKIDAVTGMISTIAGNGTSGFAGDGGPATNAILNTPADVTFDGTGTLYIADSFNQRIRRIDISTGNINTVAGNGGYGYSGDGVTGINTALAGPYGIALDPAGNFYIADGDNARIRKVNSSTNIVSTVAGNGVASFGGDGGAATSASLNAPHYVSLDRFGNLYIADAQNGRIRKVDVTTSAVSFSPLDVGQASIAQIVAVTNVGNMPLSLSQFSASANFAVQTVGNDCSTGAPVPPGGTCNLGVVFFPTVAGNPLTGTVTITDNAPGSPHSIALSGVAIPTPPAVSLDRAVLAFGNQTVGIRTPSQSVMLTNTGGSDLIFGAITIAGANSADFLQGTNCPAILPAGRVCAILVAFTPSVAGDEAALLNIADNAGTGLQSVSLLGTGVVPPPVLVSIAINPSSPVVQAGSTLQLTATGNYSDGSTADLTSTVSWLSAQPAVATVGNIPGTSGLTTGLATGIDTISASSGTFSAAATLTVNFALTGSLSSGRSLHTATQLNNGKVLIVGGVGPSGLIAAAELYDPATGSFTPTGSLNTPREYHTATLLDNGKVLITGGCGANCGILFVGSELYDPATGTFTPTGSLNTARDIHTANLLNDGRVLIAGGYGGSALGILASAELYDPSTGTYAITGNMNVARGWHVATAVGSGKVLLTGGYNGGILASAELYDPGTGSFLVTGSLNAGRDVHTATLLNNGEVLVAGGWGGGATDLASAELYDLTSGTFVSTGGLITARQLHTATLLSNGKVLIAGGSDTNNNYFASVELYDPDTGTFSPTGNLNTARDPHTATFLNSGQVLVVGGANAGGPLDGAELYIPDTSIPAHLVSISVSPSSPTLGIDAVQRFSAIGTLDDGSTQTLQSVTWNVSDPTVATITNDATNRGAADALASGSATISACDGTICGSTTLTIDTSTTTTVSSSANLSVFNQPVTFTATVTAGTGTPTGTMNFYDGATILGTVSVVGGAGSLTSALGVGIHSITAAYSGDTGHRSSVSSALTQTVKQATTTIGLTSSQNPQLVSQPIRFTATVTSQYGGAATGSIVFKAGATTIGTAAISGNQASVTTSFATTGTRLITAQYTGDANNTRSTSPALSQAVVLSASTATTVLSSLNPAFIGQTITFTATVTSSVGSPPNGEMITFRRGATTLGTAPLVGGSASFATSSLPVGTSNITARYAGDTAFGASTSAALAEVVNKYATSAVLNSSLNPSIYGRAVTLTAIVTSAGPTTATGSVTFRSGTTNLATVTLASGVASLTRSNLPTGTLSLTAVYNGDASSASSTSPVLPQVVIQSTTSTALSSSRNPSLFGGSVTFTATVTSTTTTPTGTVTFTAGTTILGTATLNGSGIARVTVSTLPRGVTTVTAVYAGTANYTSSSASVNQTVN